jgi:uncharacterized lipoprotein YddW (UPF0748 family)
MIMNRYRFFAAGVLFITLTASAAGAGNGGAPGRQVRAMWVTTESLYNLGEIEKLVATAAAYDFDAIFVQVRRAGDAYYLSENEPRSRKLDEQAGDFDPLAETIALAHLFGLEVHAWLNVNYVWPGPDAPPMPNHVAARHPGWITVGRDSRRLTSYNKPEMARADTEGWYIDPGEKAFAAYFAGVAAEIVRKYDVDGVHLDFIRYPNYRFGYGKEMRARFLKERGGQDPILLGYHETDATIFRPAAGYDGLADRWFDIHKLEWLDWRADQVTRTVAETGRAVKAANPEVEFSAAPWANPEHAYRYVGQDWLGWLDRGLVDIICPMTYWGDAGKLADLARRLDGRKGSARVYIGVGAFNHGADYSAAVAAGLADAPADGIILFDYDSCWRKPTALPALADTCPAKEKPWQ